MPYYCTVPRCTSMAGKTKNVSFHQFPRDEELAKLWNHVLKRGKPYTKYSKVCSLHFTVANYSITTSQKNGRQYKTLRKDAIPSQNLPSELPADDCHTINGGPFQFPFNIDTTVQHQMAQAIYVQTMLAMQVAEVNEMNIINHDQSSSPNSETISHKDDISTITNKAEENKAVSPKKVTYKCNQCSKCFKDPDVFILHQRNHVKTVNNEEMLKANPILANLLKTNSENNKNVISLENQTKSALTENMANYLHNLSTIMTTNSIGDKCSNVGIDEEHKTSSNVEDPNKTENETCETISCDYKKNNVEKINDATVKPKPISEANLDNSTEIDDGKDYISNNKMMKFGEINHENLENTINKENEHVHDREESL